MGENKHMKELDAFAKKYVKEIPQEQPSINFTSNLMQKITLEPKAKVFKTQALISKKGWFGIVVLVFLTLFLTFNHTGERSLSIPEINFSISDHIEVSTILEGISFSTTTIYAFVFFGLLFFTQFLFLRNHFDKRFE